MPIKPGRSWCDAQDHHGAETSFAAARPATRPAVAVPGDRDRILRGGFHREPGEGVLSPGHCIEGISPPWGWG